MSGALEEGGRCGRFVLLRDRDGTWHAVAAVAVAAVCDGDAGTTLLLPGGRVVVVNRPFGTVLGWLEMGGRPV
ncbi:MAG: hypothetical protein K2X11_08335 [Acetobacteraceae bacterium]|nr:hypothetical protein [Acetobacteraceae bacterium]